jgi:hypothetical protein
MIRIVGVQRNSQPDQEFVLLQNQGSMRANLRGHLLVNESAFLSGEVGDNFHPFTEEVSIGAGQYVVIYTGFGSSRWVRTKDGTVVYHTYMGRRSSVWEHALLPLHILNVQHSYSERAEHCLHLN